MTVFVDAFEHVRRDFLAVPLKETTAMEPEEDGYGLCIGWQVEIERDFESLDSLVDDVLL